jgi:hypothetical protein
MRLPTAKTGLSPSIQPRNRVFGGTYGKQLLSLAAAFSLVTWAAHEANGVNVLFNGTLDQIGVQDQANATPLGWSTVATKSISGGFNDGGDSEPWCNVVDAGGYGFFFKPFQGTVTPIPDLLDVFLYQDNAATSNSLFTLSGYAAGEANFCAFFNTNSPAPKALFVIEFLDNSSTIIASNAYDLVAAGMPNGGPSAMSSFHYTTPQVTAPFGTAKVRAGAWLLNAYNPNANPQSFFVDGFDLELISPPGSPVITNQPVAATVAPGGTAHFNVGVSNTAGVTYQWQLNGTSLTDGGNISGANAATLNVANASTSDVGHYRVLVANSSGSVYSSDAPLALQVLNFFPAVTLNGKLNDTYRVDYTTSLTPPVTWTPLATNKLTASPQYFFDTTSPGPNKRFYRSVFLF